MTALIIHGHFYQPPRENPWTGSVDVEPDAQPFHDWNERITAECYQPNSSVRIVNPSTGQEQFVNNYEHLSFNFGPTLLSWLQHYHPETYAAILAADAASVKRRGGHGNAIAQAYNHPILPLCNERDQRTQVRWGLADFRHRFGRKAEAMWLPETACSHQVLDLLIDHGLRFVILAPHQAERVRQRRPGVSACHRSDAPEAFLEWKTVRNAEIDPSVPYQYFHRDGSRRSIAVFFYNQSLAHAIAFEQALASSSTLVDRFLKQADGAGLVNIATDGETYGHHHRFGDLCLAYVLEIEAPARGFCITNYGEYLDKHLPVAEVETSNGPDGEGSSWSCLHGVGRWARDCGCKTGGAPDWNQAWRQPLRAALDFLRDTVAEYFEATRGTLFNDPWAARDAAIELVLDNQKSRETFAQQHAPRTLTAAETGEALMHLEVQRHLLLMYSSCGWFFNDISGIEPVQVLKYAARAIELLADLGLPSPRRRFLEILEAAKSNRPEMGTGADIYRHMVEHRNREP